MQQLKQSVNTQHFITAYLKQLPVSAVRGM